MTGDKKHIVVLTGAGISAESGLKTFRDSDGLWNGHDVYEVASPRGWKKNPKLVLDFYNARRRDVANALPNLAHETLVKLEDYFRVTIITQNIDDLHERAGSKHIIHLHGEIFKMRSEWDESLVFDIHDDIKIGDRAPDNGQLRPDIVWFEEPVPKIEEAVQIVRTCDCFVVIGTSLQVYPAASLLHYVSPGIPVYLIDKQLPKISNSGQIHLIEKNATAGAPELYNLLIKSIHH